MSRRLLLITGIPGTGKTTIGKYLEAHHGFMHVNREVHQPPAFSADPKGFVAAARQDVVATWGFRPKAPDDLAGVEELRQLGFVGVWLDGYRPWALRQILAARPEKEWEFYLQMFNVTTSGIVDALGFPTVNPFTPEGEFRSKPDIARELLAHLPRAAS
jgi:hypothetical protein